MASSVSSRGRRPWRIVLVGVGLFVCLVVGGIGGVLAYLHVAFGFTLRDQPVRMRLPPTMKIRAEITNVLDVDLNAAVTAEVPIQQVFRPRLRGRYDTEVSLEADVPVAFTVRHQAVLPVDTFADIEAHANFIFVKEYRNIQIHAKVPMKFDLPVDLTIPVEQTLHVVFRGPMAFEIDQGVTLPVNETIVVHVPIDEKLSTPVTAAFDLQVKIPRQPIPIIINRTALRMSLQTLRLAPAPNPNLPRREEP